MDGNIATGVGFTVIVKVGDAPVQPLAVGVTLIVPLIGLAVVLVVVKLGVLLVPAPERPMVVLLLFQV